VRSGAQGPSQHGFEIEHEREQTFAVYSFAIGGNLKKQRLLLALFAVASVLPALGEERLSLSGTWRYQLDRDDAGIGEQWYVRHLFQKVKVPIDLASQGIGDPVTLQTNWSGHIVDKSFFKEPEYAPYREPGNFKVPFWLQPQRYYAGTAWYQREVDIPASWSGQRIVLFIERPHWETRVWLDDKSFGSDNSLATPHVYELGTDVKPGRHRLTVRIDNRKIIDVGYNSHSISDHTQGNWNGMVGRIELYSTPPVYLENVQVYPNIRGRILVVKANIGNATGTKGVGLVDICLDPGQIRHRFAASWDTLGGRFEAQIPLGPEAVLWDEFNPYLYHLKLRLNDGPSTKLLFGMREIRTGGTQFLINDRKTFFRGTLECAIFPKTGHPPTDVESWKRIVRIAKAHGLNNIRFHSWCPPEAAFAAADELGFYYMVECSSWANGSASLGDGKPIDAWIYQEADRILEFYGNHPSFVLMPYGNEPGGKNQNQFLGAWVNHYKAQDPRRLYTSASGWPQIPENEFHVTPDPRLQAWGAGLNSRINGMPPETMTDYGDYIKSRSVPVISHEIGQWCVYPNFAERKKYTGYLKPKNFDIFEDRLAANGMQKQAEMLLLASGKLQTLCYKEEVESALRTAGMGGFQLLDLHDFPGQGSALVGVLDPFWDSKGYVTPQEFSRFCNSTVPLARLPKRVYSTQDTLVAAIEVAHFSAAPLAHAVCVWRLVDSHGKVMANGKLPPRDLAVDNGLKVGTVRIVLSSFPVPAQYKLVVGIENTCYENDWDVWVYPERIKAESVANLLITKKLDDAAITQLHKGGKVLWLVPPSQVRPDEKRGPIALGFSSIFWNTAWTRNQAPHTLGILCDPEHPALCDFPTEYHSNWQWWYIVHGAGAMIMNGLPVAIKPVIQVIDDWFTARRLALAFEARAGSGKIFICSVDWDQDLKQNPVQSQLQSSILTYLAGERFAPKVQATIEQLRTIVKDESIQP
jgi:hypothetical protein